MREASPAAGDFRRSHDRSRIVRASVSSAIRDAAAPAAPPLSGCASRSRRRKRRFTSSRSTSMPARKPEHLHRPALLGARCRATLSSSGGPPGCPVARRAPAAGAGTFHIAVGDERAPPRRASRPPQRPSTTRRIASSATSRPLGGSARRAHDRAEHLRHRRAVHVDLDDELPVFAEHAMARPVEAVHVVLEAVPQRDARDRRARARASWSRRGKQLALARRRSRAGSSPRPPRAARRRARARTSAGTRHRARPDASACAGGCGGRSARRAARRFLPQIFGPSMRRMRRVERTSGDRSPRRRSVARRRRSAARPRRPRAAIAPSNQKPLRPSTSPPRAAGSRAARTTGTVRVSDRDLRAADGAVRMGGCAGRRHRGRLSMPPAVPRPRPCCRSSIARVVGPTPPSRGVIQPATSAHASSTSGTHAPALHRHARRRRPRHPAGPCRA